MEEFAIVAFLLGGVGVVASATVSYLRTQRQSWPHRLRRLRRSLLRDLKPGVVKIVGRIRALHPVLKAPISGRACQGHVTEVIKTGGENEYVTDRATSCVDFLVEDDTGVALIRAASTALLLEVDRTYSSGWLTDPQPRVLAYLQERQIDPKGFVFNQSLRVAEGILEEGETIVVCGHARQELDPAPASVEAYREVPTRFVIQGHEGAPMLISDDPALVELGRRAL